MGPTGHWSGLSNTCDSGIAKGRSSEQVEDALERWSLADVGWEEAGQICLKDLDRKKEINLPGLLLKMPDIRGKNAAWINKITSSWITHTLWLPLIDNGPASSGIHTIFNCKDLVWLPGTISVCPKMGQ